jgi:hypothetical protein
MDCGRESPETDTDYTLISSKHAWRLIKQKGPDGSVRVEWRCPSCWAAHKRTRPEIATAVAAPPPGAIDTKRPPALGPAKGPPPPRPARRAK